VTAIARPRHTRSIARSTAVLVLVASAGYVAGAVVHGTFSTRGASAAFAQPIEAATSEFHEPGRSALPSSAFDWTRSIVEYVEAPRECDATHGPTTECIFND
jgi:hypothetical protein